MRLQLLSRPVIAVLVLLAVAAILLYLSVSGSSWGAAFATAKGTFWT